MSAKKVGFTAMTSESRAVDVPEIGIGMLGYAFMGKAHSNAMKKMPYIFWPPPAKPRLVKICGRTEDKVKEEAQRYEYEEYCTDWHDLINDDRIEIMINGTPPDMHLEPCVEAAKAGKHILCEKPLARNSEEARIIRDAAVKAGIKHICNFNYRMIPAVVLAKQLISDGKLGRLYHFRARYLQEWIADPEFPLVWRLQKDIAGNGVVGCLGSHIIDLARFLCGEPTAVMSTARTFIDERPLGDGSSNRGKVDVEDAFVSTVEFDNGAIGTLEGSRFCHGRKNFGAIEINGELGSISLDLEDMNVLQIYFKDEPIQETAGFHSINVTEAGHPYIDKWWPHGHIIGWEHTFVHSAYNMVNAIINDAPLEPMVATFEDGYRTAVICDAILKSAETERKEKIVY
jgi:predicted dehydrogenase